MRRSRSFERLWRGIELTSGGQREHRYEVLRAQVADAGMAPEAIASYLERYFLDMFRHGGPPHTGPEPPDAHHVHLAAPAGRRLAVLTLTGDDDDSDMPATAARCLSVLATASSTSRMYRVATPLC